MTFCHFVSKMAASDALLDRRLPRQCLKHQVTLRDKVLQTFFKKKISS